MWRWDYPAACQQGAGGKGEIAPSDERAEVRRCKDEITSSSRSSLIFFIFFFPATSTPSAASQKSELTEGNRTFRSDPCHPVSFSDAPQLATLQITAICCRSSPSAAC